MIAAIEKYICMCVYQVKNIYNEHETSQASVHIHMYESVFKFYLNYKFSFFLLLFNIFKVN